MTASRMGRPSIFGVKVRRYQGSVTQAGTVAFENHRRELAKLAKWPVSKVSDGDVFTYLALGREKTLEELNRK
jgi:hypothetical protein